VAPLVDLAIVILSGFFEWLVHFVETSSGAVGLVAVAIYSFLIAFVLPLPSEVVLAATVTSDLPQWLNLTLIIIVSATGKAAGSVFAHRLGQEAKHSDPVLRAFERMGLDVHGWSERQTARLASRYGYGGLAMALSVPFFPDTVSIYAFSLLSEDYHKFALATLVGSAGRLLVTLALLGGAIAVF
jgi:membrane protein YqaA with SNARE-associated domain